MNGSEAGFDIYALGCLTDIHLHLDGAISPASARKLAAAQGIDVPENDEELTRLIRVSKNCGDLNEFLEKFDFPCSLLQTEEGIRQAVENLLSELKKQGVMYAEIRFAPQKLTEKGLTQYDAVSAAIAGMEGAGIDASLILCCMRGDDNHAQNVETVLAAEKYLGRGVAALDLAGAEGLFPTAEFEDIFALARQKGIPFTIHAGEADGPESIRKAIDMGAFRIGHGVRSLEDRVLLEELADRKIPLELCPTSNICTGIFGKIDDWPLRELLSSGMVITVNTDDPAIEGTTIKDEFSKLIDSFGIGGEEVKKLLVNSVMASFADAKLKQTMMNKINADFGKAAAEMRG